MSNQTYNHKKQLKKLLINTKNTLQDIFKNDFFAKGEQEFDNLLKQSMECLLVKKINLDGDDASKTENNNLEDAEIANQLYNLHTKILRMFILTAFDMSRDILITPKRLLYAKEKENELYEQLMIIAKEKQEEIKFIIQNTIEQMKDNLVDKAANFVFKENTLFNIPTNYQHEDNYYYCNLLDCNQSTGICQSECFMNQNAKCLSDKCDSVLHSASDEQCWCASDEPDYQYIDQNQPEDESLILVQNDHNELNHQNNENLNNSKLRRHHSMQHRHNSPLQSCCHHHEQFASQQPRRANSQQHFKNYNLNCNQQQHLNPQNTTQSTQYVSCEYADSGCASGNCCSSTCEQPPFVQSDFHQRHSTATTANSNTDSSGIQQDHQQHHQQHHQSDNHLIVKQQQSNSSPVKKESFLKRFTNKFAISSSSIVKPEPEKDYSQKVIEQLNELQIKDKQDYEDLKNHLSHLMHLDRLNKQKKLQHKLDQSQHHCLQSYHLNHFHQSSLVANQRQIKITLKDLCAAQNEIQEYILSLLNKQIANDIVNSVNILKKNYIGTLERCLTALENGVSSIAQHEQLTTALAAAVEFDSPSKNLTKNVKRKISNKYNSSPNGKKYLGKDCQQPTPNDNSIACSSFNNHPNKNTRQQNSIDCDCSLSSDVSDDESSNSANSDFDSTDEHNADTDDEYSFLNRTHHECSDALKQILTAAYQVEINLKTNSGFLKSYWDKIRQLVFNCTVTLWKLNYAPSSKSINQQNLRTFCTSCQSNLSLMDTNQHNLNNKTSSYNSCPPVFNLGNSSEIIDSCNVSSMDCDQTNCCCNLVVDCEDDHCAEDDCCCDQIDNAGQTERPKFKRLRQTSLHSYVKIDQHTNQFLDSHCSNHLYNCHHSINPVDLVNNKLQFDSIIDWKRKVALEVLSNLNLTRLSKSICAQFKEKLRQSHEQFSQAIRHLEQLHLEKRKRTEQQRSNLRKCFAPRIARFALEAICLKDQINYGMPKLGREIGRGQYGVVFQCSKWAGRSKLAIKSVVPPDDKHWNDLAMEFYYTKSIPEHERIVQIRGSVINYNYGSVLLIMDRLNQDLYTAIKNGLEWTARLQVAIDVVEGIRFLHSQGLIHRDIKLKNVLLDGNNRAKLSDFGFCKTASMISGSIVGTPIHMSSEILSGKYDHTIDIYAFGILFWYICAGHVRLPYVFEQCQNKDQLWNYVRKGSRPERLPHFDQTCWEIMSECWKGDPSERPLLGDVEIKLYQILHRYQNAQAISSTRTFFRSNSCNTQHSSNRPILNRNLVNSPNFNSPLLNNSPTLFRNSPLANSPQCRNLGIKGGRMPVQPSCSVTTTDEQSTLFDQFNKSIDVKN